MMKSGAPFTSYINCMELLARRDDVVSRELKPGDTKERVI